MDRVLEMENALQLWDVLGGDRASSDSGSIISSSPFQNHLQPPLSSNNTDSSSLLSVENSAPQSSTTLRHNI